MSMRSPLIGLALLAGLTAPASFGGEASEAEVRAILSDMAAREHQFKPARLHRMGLPGLMTVLDELLPDTAAASQLKALPAEVERLVERLGDDNARVREAATKELFALGPAATPWVEKAARNSDAEISWRAARVLRAWEARKWEDKTHYVPGFAVYAAGIHDDQRLRELARRASAALQSSWPGAGPGGLPEDGRYAILELCVRAVGNSAQDEYVDLLRPLLKHTDVQVAVLVTQWVGEATASNPGTRFCPALLLEALQSDREEVATSAVCWAGNCGDTPHKAEIQRLLVALFEGKNEQLKFQTCAPLIQTYHYPAALDYLLQQAKGADLNRRYSALAGLSSPRQDAAPEKKLFDALVELLKSSDGHTRYMAVLALSSYSGEEVVKHLLPMLADTYNIIPNELGNRLAQQSDKAMLRRHLTAVKDDTKQKDKVRQQAAAILDDLEQRQ
jgi:HEAT repeat protein